jgi:putative membrane protein
MGSFHRTNARSTVTRAGIAAALVVTTAAAAGAQGTAPAPGSATTASPPRQMSANATEASARPVLREPVAEMYTDAKIAAVASTSNMSEILPSQLALRKAQSPQVRQYAQRMIADHQRLEQQMQQMLKAKGVTPEHNGYSYQLEQNLQPMMRELQAASGAEFDKLYMTHQVGSHMSTLHALDTSLIPNARDPQMKAMLQQQARPAVAAHFAEGRRIHEAVVHGSAR